MHVTTGRGTATVVDAFLATVEARGDAPAILDADVKVALSWRDHADLRRRWGFGELVTALTGAAPCPPGLIEFFASIGIELREVYLLSETTGVVSLPAAHDVRGGNRADIATLNRSGSLDARFCLSHEPDVHCGLQ